ncbi:MAG: LLM class flavin-dependent oxidoreductase, partial [Chloroflexi bacterium]|nr:LLM class flavin-dependent oxidoreductase [Chloroflexota bacterium]
MPSMDQFSVFAFAAGDPPPTAAELIQAARHADALGFYSISLPHHLTLPEAQVYTGFPQRNILDPLVLLPAMAAVTQKIHVGTNSAIIPILPPYVWARYFSTLDALSGGRALAGMAMGWFRKDFAAANANHKRRARHFDEALGLIRRLWTEESVTHQGETCSIED